MIHNLEWKILTTQAIGWHSIVDGAKGRDCLVGFAKSQILGQSSLGAAKNSSSNDCMA
jgi:hypothetical protein